MTEDRLEDLLVRQGEHWRAAQPAAPSLSTLAAAPRTSPERAPWLLPALVAAALLAPLLTTYALVRGHQPDQATQRVVTAPAAPVPVPWAPSPSGAPMGPDRLGSRTGVQGLPPKGTRPCGSSDFGHPGATATAGAFAGRYVLTFQRVGSQACAIGNSTPTVYLREASGRTLGVGRPALLIAYPGHTLLQPGDVLLAPTQICGSGIASLDLQLAAVPAGRHTIGQPDGATVSIPFAGRSTCTAGASAISHHLAVPGGSLNSLVRSYSVPDRVRSGQSLDYSVTLTNPTATAVSLEPCPSYSQALVDVLELPDKQGATSAGQLNCAAAPASVPARGSITFQLRLDIRGVPDGDRRLVWDWLGSTLTDGDGYAEFPTVTVY